MQLVDRRYRLVGVAPEAEADAPVVWTDTVPVIRFEVGPASQVDAGAFADWLKDGGAGTARAADGVCGAQALQYTYSLTGLSLVELGEGGAETELAGPFQALWQMPRDLVSDATAKGGRELALLTLDPALWSHRLVEPAKAPLDPTPWVRHGLHPEGGRASGLRPSRGRRPAGRAVALAGPPAAAAALRLRFGVELRSWFLHPIDGRRIALDPLFEPCLSGTNTVAGGELVGVPPGIRAPDGLASLAQGLRAPGIAGPGPGREFRNMIQTRLTLLDTGFDAPEPVSDPELWIGVPNGEREVAGVSVTDDRGRVWEPAFRELDGYGVLVFAPLRQCGTTRFKP